MSTDNVQNLLRERGGHSPLQKLVRHMANQRAWTDQVKAALGDNLKNQAKWEAADEWCKDRGYEFKVFTEKELGIKYGT